MGLRRLAGMAALLVSLAACAGPSGPVSPSGTATLDGGFTPRGVRWTGDASGLSVALLKLRNAEGRTMVCGALVLHQVPNMWRNAVIESMQRASVLHGGVTLTGNLRWAAGPYDSESVGGRAANCVTTAVPWSAAFEDPAPLRLSGVYAISAVRPPSGGGAAMTLAGRPETCDAGVAAC